MWSGLRALVLGAAMAFAGQAEALTFHYSAVGTITGTATVWFSPAPYASVGGPTVPFSWADEWNSTTVWNISVVGTSGLGTSGAALEYTNHPLFKCSCAATAFISINDANRDIAFETYGSWRNGYERGPMIVGVTFFAEQGIQLVQVPGPVAGAGIPALLAAGGLWFATRRRGAAAT